MVKCLKCGNVMYSDNACSDIISQIAAQLCSEIYKYVIKTKAKFSVMVDDSTSVSIAQSSIVNFLMIYVYIFVWSITKISIDEQFSLYG